jgi:hypothetical protein
MHDQERLIAEAQAAKKGSPITIRTAFITSMVVLGMGSIAVFAIACLIFWSRHHPMAAPAIQKMRKRFTSWLSDDQDAAEALRVDQLFAQSKREEKFQADVAREHERKRLQTLSEEKKLDAEELLGRQQQAQIKREVAAEYRDEQETIAAQQFKTEQANEAIIRAAEERVEAKAAKEKRDKPTAPPRNPFIEEASMGYVTPNPPAYGVDYGRQLPTLQMRPVGPYSSGSQTVVMPYSGGQNGIQPAEMFPSSMFRPRQDGY